MGVLKARDCLGVGMYFCCTHLRHPIGSFCAVLFVAPLALIVKCGFCMKILGTASVHVSCEPPMTKYKRLLHHHDSKHARETYPGFLDDVRHTRFYLIHSFCIE